MIEHEPISGRITDGHIRYVMLRADVLMGIAAQMPKASLSVFLTAFEASAAQHAQGSFERYKSFGSGTLHSLLQTTVKVAGTLGWGGWDVKRDAAGRIQIIVSDSPFAEGLGASSMPACGAITGVLQALFSVDSDHKVRVHESQCAAQGYDHCQFNVVTSDSQAVSNDRELTPIAQPRTP